MSPEVPEPSAVGVPLEVESSPGTELPQVIQEEPAADAPALELPTTDLDVARSARRAEIWTALDERHGLEPRSAQDPAPSQDSAASLPALSKAYVRDAIAARLAAKVKGCYERALAEQPTLAGKLTVRFELVAAEGLGGFAETAEVVEGSSSLDAPAVRRCTLAAVLSAQFPAPTADGRAVVTYPFVFSPTGEG
nr:AgmX/PglI C-terminal domain-containing protein [Pseudenhygromyxa sp. WMMC2535]